MALRPLIMAPWVPTQASYSLAVDVSGSPHTLSIDVTPGREYWASGDGLEHAGEEDLATIVCASFLSATSRPCAVSITSDGRLSFEFSVGDTYEWRWDDADTTLPPEVLGFPRETFTASSEVITAPYSPRGAWVPERCSRFDSDDVPQYVAASAVTSSGEGRGYMLGESYRRELAFTLLPASKVLRRQAEDGTYSSGTWRALTEAMRYWVDGSRLRIYDDVTQDDWRTYRFVPGDMPRPMQGMNALRYEATLNFRSATAPFTSAASFDFADTGYLDLTLSSSDASELFDAAPEISWSLWVRPDALGNDVLITHQTTTDGCWQILLTSAGAIRVEIAKTTSDWTTYWTSSSSVAPAGTWTHLVVVWDGGASGTAKLRVYIDGAPEAGTYSGTWTQTVLTTITAPIYWAQNQLAAARFNGQLDEVAIWDYALSADDAAEIYNDGVPRTLFDLTNAPAPVAWWRGESDTLDSSGSDYHLDGDPTGYGEPAVGA